ncbi:unnamed protein product [Effrenium voratum]|uniref:Uncharacterized protein n=1 Tax=Effrenium voratum TaxID=2562239 RepID=A0AA36IPC8_9DINO|nr:unnamed protein product [Effrenium voratum]
MLGPEGKQLQDQRTYKGQAGAPGLALKLLDLAPQVVEAGGQGEAPCLEELHGLGKALVFELPEALLQQVIPPLPQAVPCLRRTVTHLPALQLRDWESRHASSGPRDRRRPPAATKIGREMLLWSHTAHLASLSENSGAIRSAMFNYEVVAPADLGGALVREGKSLSSQQLARLGIGAVVSELERAGERLRFKKVAGCGPETGWVSCRLLEKCEASKAAPTRYQGQSLLAQAETHVLEKGAPAALKAAGKDGAGRLTASLAHLAQGETEAAAQCAEEAMTVLKGNKDGEASASLALALSAEPKTGLGHAMTALSSFKELGDKQMEASTLTALANIRLALGELTVAEASLRDALRIFREIKDVEGEQAAVATLLEVASAREGAEKAPAAVCKERAAYYKSKGDKLGEGQALRSLAEQLLGVQEAASLASEALSLLQEAGDKKGQAAALQTVALAQHDWAKAEEALKISESLGDEASQVDQLLTLSSLLGEPELARAKAAQARQLAKKLSDLPGQGRAGHAEAAAALKLGRQEEALALAKEAAEMLSGAAQGMALRTAACAAEPQEALRMAKDVKILFHKLGDRCKEEALDALVLQIEETLPKITPNPRLTVAQQDSSINLTANSLFTQSSNCIVWSLPLQRLDYIMYCLELLKFADDLKNIPDKVAFLVMTKGVMARHTGEMVPSQFTAPLATTVWAICRTIRLESPKLLVCTVDLPSSSTVHEMTDCIRAAQVDPGPRNEISFIVDRRNQLGKRPY